jgi:lipoyl(octanoyl) transferase
LQETVSKLSKSVIIRSLGCQDYVHIWEAMKHFTDTRLENTVDEIWLLEHPPVYTQGQAGKAEHILNSGCIPIVQTDRGGQVTYHGPGQLVVYTLFDLRRLKIGIRQLVTQLEQVVIRVLQDYQVSAKARCDAPGVYVEDAKICSIGLRVRKGCSYHGIAFNIQMDLEPFLRINPCGFHNLTMTQLSDFVPEVDMSEVANKTIIYLQQIFEYSQTEFIHFSDT